MNLTKFSATYPTIAHFLATNIYPEADSYNLIELLHRVMKHGHPENTKNLLLEFKHINEDFDFSNRDLAEIFNANIPPEYTLFSEDNARVAIRILSDYLSYLYEEEDVRGSSKWLRTNPQSPAKPET